MLVEDAEPLRKELWVPAPVKDVGVNAGVVGVASSGDSRVANPLGGEPRLVEHLPVGSTPKLASASRASSELPGRKSAGSAARHNAEVGTQQWRAHRFQMVQELPREDELSGSPGHITARGKQ